MLTRIVVALFLSLSLATVAAQAAPSRPNILLVLLDDAGFMDLGGYGGDTSTPTIDSLGNAGVKLTKYYTTPLCGPSRATLMTGRSAHQVSAATLTEVLTDEMRAMPAYGMRWTEGQQTLASRLKSAGYQTFVSGKWGIGDIGANLPNRFGFDRSWVLDSTGSSNYSAKSYLPHYREVKWYEDGRRVDLPSDFYSSRNIVDKMIQYLNEGDPARPFFAYLSFQAIHVPVQAPKEFIEKYNGVFDRGWDVIREERHKRAMALGLIPNSAKPAASPVGSRKWDELTSEEKRYWSRVMQVNSGMMESADFHLGRLLSHLKAIGQLENTIILVTSDNGPEYNTIGKTSKGAIRTFEEFWMSLEGWDVNYHNLGQRESHAAIGPEWASVSAAPFHLFKFSASEGGTRVPLVVSGPNIKRQGFIDARTQVADITPTLLDFAGVGYKPSDFYGRSIKPLLTGDKKQIYGDTDSFVFEVSGAAALYRGSWKLTKTPPPLGDGKWHLYNLSVDPSETDDLSDTNATLVKDMLNEYNTYAREVGIFEYKAGESASKQLVANAIMGTLKNYWYIFAAIGLILLSLMLIVVRGGWIIAKRLRARYAVRTPT